MTGSQLTRKLKMHSKLWALWCSQNAVDRARTLARMIEDLPASPEREQMRDLATANACTLAQAHEAAQDDAQREWVSYEEAHRDLISTPRQNGHSVLLGGEAL